MCSLSKDDEKEQGTNTDRGTDRGIVLLESRSPSLEPWTNLVEFARERRSCLQSIHGSPIRESVLDVGEIPANQGIRRLHGSSELTL